MNFLKKLSERNRDFRTTRPVVIACFGDSVTHGCFEIAPNGKGGMIVACRSDEAYHALLAKELGAYYPNAMPNIINAGVSGDNAANALKRLERDVLFAKPDLVIVNFGLNDSMNPDKEAGLETYRASMKAIFEKVLASGAECMLLTPNFMCKDVSPFLTDERFRTIAKSAAAVQNSGTLEAYVEAACEEAAKLNVPVADAYAVWKALSENGVDTDRMLSNHINHPTKEATRIFTDEIMRTLLKE